MSTAIVTGVMAIVGFAVGWWLAELSARRRRREER